MVFITEMFTILGGNNDNNKIDESSKSLNHIKHNSVVTNKQNSQNVYDFVKKACCDEKTCNGRFYCKNSNNHCDINNNDGYTNNKQDIKNQKKTLRNSTESKDSNVKDSPTPHNKNNNNTNKKISNMENLLEANVERTNTPTCTDIAKGKKSSVERFKRNFPDAMGPDDAIIKTYHCAYVSDHFLQGYLYITTRFFCFYSKLFHKKKLIKIPLHQVIGISKKKTAKVIPNAVGITTATKEYSFGSLLSRDKTYKYMLKTWNCYKAKHPQSHESSEQSNEEERTSFEDSQSQNPLSESTSWAESISNMDEEHNDGVASQETSGDDVSHISNFEKHQKNRIDDEYYNERGGYEDDDNSNNNNHTPQGGTDNSCHPNKGKGNLKKSFILSRQLSNVFIPIVHLFTTHSSKATPKSYLILIISSVLVISLMFSTLFLTIHLNHLEKIFEKLEASDNVNSNNNNKVSYDNDCRTNRAYDEAEDLEYFLTPNKKPQCSIQTDEKIIDSHDVGGEKKQFESVDESDFIMDESLQQLANIHTQLLYKMESIIKLLNHPPENSLDLQAD